MAAAAPSCGWGRRLNQAHAGETHTRQITAGKGLPREHFCSTAGDAMKTIFTPQRHPMAGIPDSYLDLLGDKNAFAHLATLMCRTSSPQVTPVWFDYASGAIRVNQRAVRVGTAA